MEDSLVTELKIKSVLADCKLVANDLIWKEKL